jgi:hypothetical protein
MEVVIAAIDGVEVVIPAMDSGAAGIFPAARLS